MHFAPPAPGIVSRWVKLHMHPRPVGEAANKSRWLGGTGGRFADCHILTMKHDRGKSRQLSETHPVGLAEGGSFARSNGS